LNFLLASQELKVTRSTSNLGWSGENLSWKRIRSRRSCWILFRKG